MLADKPWIQLRNRSCLEYLNGIQGFLDFALEHIKEEEMKIKYPCIDCNNKYRKTRDKVEQHLLSILKRYCQILFKSLRFMRYFR